MLFVCNIAQASDNCLSRAVSQCRTKVSRVISACKRAAEYAAFRVLFECYSLKDNIRYLLMDDLDWMEEIRWYEEQDRLDREEAALEKLIEEQEEVKVFEIKFEDLIG